MVSVYTNTSQDTYNQERYGLTDSSAVSKKQRLQAAKKNPSIQYDSNNDTNTVPSTDKEFRRRYAHTYTPQLGTSKNSKKTAKQLYTQAKPDLRRQKKRWQRTANQEARRKGKKASRTKRDSLVPMVSKFTTKKMVGWPILLVSIAFWKVIQIPLALISLAALGITAGVATSASIAARFIDLLIGNGIVGAGFRLITGRSAGEAAAATATDFAAALFFGVWILITIILWIWLLGLLTYYTLLKTVGVKLEPLYDSSGGLRFTFFLVAFVFYAIPGLNLIPWTILWSTHIWIKPS